MVNIFFQQDNAPIHTSSSTQSFMEEMEITSMPWPGLDLDPIEHLWDELECQLQAKKNHPKNLRD